MSGREWVPGAVAMATAPDGRDFMVVRTGGGEHDYWSAPRGWPTGSVSDYECELRPLVVLDLHAANDALPDGEVAETAIKTLRRSPWISDTGLADQIEAQTRPAKPEEPESRGAVVKDTTGLEWVRVHPGGEAWVNGYQRWATWAEIDAVEVVRS